MNSLPNLTERILRGSSVVFLFSVLASPLGYFIRILYSHSLSIEAYGLFYAMMTLFSTISTYNDLGFGYSVSYLLPKCLKENDHFLAWNIFQYCQIIEITTSVIISLFLVVLAPWITQNYFKVPEAQNLIYVFCLFLVASSLLNSLIKIFMGMLQEKYYATLNFARIFFAFTFSLVISLFDTADVLLYAIAWTLSYLLVAGVYYYFLYAENKLLVRQRVVWDSKLFRTMLDYALPTLATVSIYSFITFTDTFFLTLFKGVKDVGVYNVILPVASIPLIMLSPINNFFLPLVSHLMEGEKEKVAYVIEILLKVIPFVGIYFGFFVFLFPSTTIALLFGEKWVEEGAIPLMILALGYVPAILNIFLAGIVLGMGKIRERLIASLTIAFASIILNASLVFFYGLSGAAIAATLIYILSNAIYGLIISRTITFNYPYKYYLQLIGIFTFFYLVVKLGNWQTSNWSSYIISGAIYTVAVIGIAYYFKIFRKDLLLMALGKENKVILSVELIKE